MKEQNYEHHRFYYWPHHFLFYGCVALASALCLFGFWQYPEQRFLWAVTYFLVLLIVGLGFMTRQHYSLGNQNRIVRLEMRLRYYLLTGKRFEEIERQLSFGRIAALRFASDEELPALIGRAVNENLTSDQIKRAIKHWLPDKMRV
jgi:hypothetical protein